MDMDTPWICLIAEVIRGLQNSEGEPQLSIMGIMKQEM
jgi:hypothetical protein